MKVIILFQILLFAFVLKTFGQDKYVLPSNKYIGIQTRLIDHLPLEISYLNIKSKKMSWHAKVGYVYAPINSVKSYILSSANNSTFNNYNFSTEQYVKSFYLKSGFLFYKNYDKLGYLYFALNGVYAFAWNTFETTVNDAIYGKIVRSLKEESVHKGIEIEWQRITKEGFNLGILIGYNINQIIPFQSKIKNIEKVIPYSPGMGYGDLIYFNIQVGYHFKFKNKK